MTELQNYRYERKFLVDSMAREDVAFLVRQHPAMFSEIFHSRWINNIYLDSPDLKSVTTSVDGTSRRTKTRVRWYGRPVGHIEAPALERKSKRGMVGWKESFRLGPFELTDTLEMKEIERVFKGSELPARLLLELGMLRPTLMNRYARRYFRSADRNFRITIDTDVRSRAIRPLGNQSMRWAVHQSLVVVELKYSPVHDADASRITEHLPFRLSRNSKYVSGMRKAYPI